jgi:hypothetical protein
MVEERRQDVNFLCSRPARILVVMAKKELNPLARHNRALHPVPGGHGKVHVTLPADAAEGDAAEAAYYLETLRANHRIVEEPEPLSGDETHRIETDAEGHKVLRRKRFSAV